MGYWTFHIKLFDAHRNSTIVTISREGEDNTQMSSSGFWHQEAKYAVGKLIRVPGGRWINAITARPRGLTLNDPQGKKVLQFDELDLDDLDPPGAGSSPKVFAAYRSVSRGRIFYDPGSGYALKPIRWELVSVRYVEAIEDIWSRIRDIAWQFITSDGRSVSVGHPRIPVQITGGTGRIFIRGASERSDAEHILQFTAAGGSAGKGIEEMLFKKLEWMGNVPLSTSGSTTDCPSAALEGHFYAQKERSLNDFNGMVTFVELNASMGAIPSFYSLRSKSDVNSRALTLVIFHKAPFLPVDMLSSMTCVGIIDSMSVFRGAGTSLGGSWMTGSVQVVK